MSDSFLFLFITLEYGIWPLLIRGTQVNERNVFLRCKSDTDSLNNSLQLVS